MYQFVEQPFLIGVLVGLSVAVPIGPVALTCIRRTLGNGFSMGMASGLGAATVHFIYGMAALSGFGAMREYLDSNQSAVRVAGGLIIILLAVRMFLKSHLSAKSREHDGSRSVAIAYGTTGLLALSSPVTILGLASNLTAFGLVKSSMQWQAGAGMFCGSIFWWIVLCGVIVIIRNQIGPRATVRINRSAAAVMAGLGLTSILHVL